MVTTPLSPTNRVKTVIGTVGRGRYCRARRIYIDSHIVTLYCHYMTSPNYSIVELAELGGVSRRTVRYYVQESLLPPPLGVGRGRHYGSEHLARLLAVKAMQEQGMTLEEIRDAGSAGKRQLSA